MSDLELIQTLIGSGGASGVIAIIAYMWIRDIRQQRDDWRNIALEAMSQNGVLLEGTKAATKLMRSVPTGRDVR